MKTIKLQGIHTPQKAIPAAELKPGMVTVWNFGYTSTVKSIEPTKSGKSVKCVIISNESGNEHIRTMRADRLVVVKEEEPKIRLIKHSQTGKEHIKAFIATLAQS